MTTGTLRSPTGVFVEFFTKLLVAAVLMLGTQAALAADPVYTGTFSNKALSGYDAVAYHTQGEAVKGDRDFSTEYNGARWQFSSAENLALFEAEPERYAPAYGGYCAWAVSQGYTAKGDPKVWAIVDGRLFVNYNADVQATWNEDRPGFITAADDNWPTVLN